MTYLTAERSNLKELVETIKTHKGFNYAEVAHIFTNTAFNKTHYECNCSGFNTEAEVINFIDSIA